MRLLRKLVLATAVLIAGCTQHGVHFRGREIAPSKPSGVVVDHALQKHLSGASARYIVKEKVGFIIDSKGNITEVWQGAWTGSAFCIDIVTPDKGPRYSLWLTCRHVADIRLQQVPSKAEIDYKDQYGAVAWADVYDVQLSDKYDIALFKSYAIPGNKLALATDRTVDNLALGDYLIAIGHPGGLFPAALTVGAFIGYTDGNDIRFTTTATYGSSGSPVIDARTMTVVGVLYKFAGGKFRSGYRSDDLKAVSVTKVRQSFFSK